MWISGTFLRNKQLMSILPRSKMMHHQVNSATVAITLVMPLLPRQTLQISPMFLIYHSVILKAAHRHRLTVHRSAMQVQQLIGIQQ